METRYFCARKKKGTLCLDEDGVGLFFPSNQRQNTQQKKCNSRRHKTFVRSYENSAKRDISQELLLRCAHSSIKTLQITIVLWRFEKYHFLLFRKRMKTQLERGDACWCPAITCTCPPSSQMQD